MNEITTVLDEQLIEDFTKLGDVLQCNQTVKAYCYCVPFALMQKSSFRWMIFSSIMFLWTSVSIWICRKNKSMSTERDEEDHLFITQNLEAFHCDRCSGLFFIETELTSHQNARRNY